MQFHARCVFCVAKSAYERSESCKNDEKRTLYMQEVAKLLQETDAYKEQPPLIEGKVIRLRREMLGIIDDFTEIKHRFNQLLLGVYDKLAERVDSADDPLVTAMQFAVAGNYVDFSVLENVEESELMRLLDEAANKPLDSVEVRNLKNDLEKGGELVFLHDNCGEIVTDKLLIRTIRKLYPDVHVLSVVRGGPVQNDATMEDAVEVALSEVSEVTDNGVADTAGTVMYLIRDELAERIRNATAVISKGQGNFETLTASGLNVYFLFLAKCPGYTDWFGLERFSAVLANDLRMPKYS